MKRLIITSVIALLGFTVMAQEEKKVAVFDPAGSADDNIKEIVREVISSVVVNTGGYTVLERQLIDKVLAENRFQAGGMVDDSQIVEMGKLMGANFTHFHYLRIVYQAACLKPVFCKHLVYQLTL